VEERRQKDDSRAKEEVERDMKSQLSLNLEAEAEGGGGNAKGEGNDQTHAQKSRGKLGKPAAVEDTVDRKKSQCWKKEGRPSGKERGKTPLKVLR